MKYRPELTADQWMEIYYAVTTKKHIASDEKDRRWVKDLQAILRILGPDGVNMLLPPRPSTTKKEVKS